MTELFRFARCDILRFESSRVSSCCACCYAATYCFLAFPPWEAAACFLPLPATGFFFAGFLLLLLLLLLALASEATARFLPFFVVAFFVVGFLMLPMLLLLLLLLTVVLVRPLVVLPLPLLSLLLSLPSDPLRGW